MAKVTYVEHNGKQHVVDVENGFSVMEGATLNMVPGIEGICGGMCACATCHCYIDQNTQMQLGLEPASEMEQEMLLEAADTRENSRLSCQIEVTEALDGLMVYLPETQTS